MRKLGHFEPKKLSKLTKFGVRHVTEVRKKIVLICLTKTIAKFANEIFIDSRCYLCSQKIPYWTKLNVYKVYIRKNSQLA